MPTNPEGSAEGTKATPTPKQRAVLERFLKLKDSRSDAPRLSVKSKPNQPLEVMQVYNADRPVGNAGLALVFGMTEAAVASVLLNSLINAACEASYISRLVVTPGEAEPFDRCASRVTAADTIRRGRALYLRASKAHASQQQSKTASRPTIRRSRICISTQPRSKAEIQTKTLHVTHNPFRVGDVVLHESTPSIINLDLRFRAMSTGVSR